MQDLNPHLSQESEILKAQSYEITDTMLVKWEEEIFMFF